MGSVGAIECRSRGRELAGTEQSQSLVKRLLIDLIRPDVGCQPAGDLGN